MDNLPASDTAQADSHPVQLCQVCGAQPSKYTCPRCEMRTCSVACVKQHKQDNDCSGERSKTHFVARDQYNYSNMMSDYVYLEDVSRHNETLTRERLRADTHEPKQKMFRDRALLKKIRFTGVQYDMLPAGMSRHKMNQTNYSTNYHTVFWTIECCFCRNGHVERIVEHSFPSGRPLRAFFDNMLISENPQGKGSFSTIRYQVREFVEAGIDRFVVGLKKPHGPKNTYVNLTPHLDRSLKDILRGERIIEFPTLYIWMQGEEDKEVTLEEKIFVDPPRRHPPKDDQQQHRQKRQRRGSRDDDDGGEDGAHAHAEDDEEQEQRDDDGDVEEADQSDEGDMEKEEMIERPVVNHLNDEDQKPDEDSSLPTNAQ